jgi:hypothetical protein
MARQDKIRQDKARHQGKANKKASKSKEEGKKQEGRRLEDKARHRQRQEGRQEKTMADQLDMGLLFANLEAFIQDRTCSLIQSLRAMSSNNSEPAPTGAADTNPLESVTVKGFSKKKDPSLSSVSQAQTENNRDAEDTHRPSLSDASMQESKNAQEDSPSATYPKGPSTSEFPNGDIDYCVDLRHDELINHRQACAVGWAMCVYGRNVTRTKVSHWKSCLGVYVCPIVDCKYRERPRVPREKKKGALPLPAKTSCVTHHEPLVHIACEANMKIVHCGNIIKVHHEGWHRHPRPRPIRPDSKSHHTFANLVRIAPEVPPKSLQMGTSTRRAVRELHPSFAI